jgi:hypothetical protein
MIGLDLMVTQRKILPEEKIFSTAGFNYMKGLSVEIVELLYALTIPGCEEFHSAR